MERHPVVALFKAVHTEDVGDPGAPHVGFDVVAEEQVPTDLNDVAGYAVVLRADAFVAGDRQLGATEEVEALRVEGLGALDQLGALTLEAFLDDLVVGPPESLRIGGFGGCCRFVSHPGS